MPGDNEPDDSPERMLIDEEHGDRGCESPLAPPTDENDDSDIVRAANELLGYPTSDDDKDEEAYQIIDEAGQSPGSVGNSEC
jgi:hypothetical protein